MHTVRSTTRPGSVAAFVVEGTSFTVTIAAGELDRQSLTHKVGSILKTILARKRWWVRSIGAPGRESKTYGKLSAGKKVSIKLAS